MSNKMKAVECCMFDKCNDDEMNIPAEIWDQANANTLPMSHFVSIEDRLQYIEDSVDEILDALNIDEDDLYIEQDYYDMLRDMEEAKKKRMY